ncbi:MAG: lipoyl protein ligase domain-containing protein [Thermoproteota archaeon]
MISSSSKPTLKAKLLNLENKEIEIALSVFETLFRRAGSLRHPHIILHSNKDKAVSLGCFQLADEDFLKSYLHKKNLKYFFRLHGGDVMLHDENQVGVGVIVPNEERYGRFYVSLMSSLMKKNGVTDFQVTDDYILCYNKVLGEVIHLEGDVLSGWFTMIYLKRNYEEIASLKSPKEQLIKERISRLKESCIGLDQVLRTQISPIKFFELVKTVLLDDLNFEPEKLRLGFGDKKLLWINRELLRRNRVSEAIQLKHSEMLKSGDAVLLSKRLINGLLRMRIKAKDRTLERISISGSFIFEPPERLIDFEKMLEGKELDEPLLIEKVTEFFINEKIKASFTAFDIVELLCKNTGDLNERREGEKGT